MDPVKQPALENPPEHAVAQAAYNPISSGSQANPSGAFNEDAELDNILTDVNHEVKAKLDSAQKAKSPGILSRSAAQLQKVKPTANKSKKSGPKLVVVLAIVVTALLIAAAVYTFRQSQKSSQVTKAHLASVEQAKTTTAKPQPATFGADYLSSFSSSLSNDTAQDFDTTPLSDSSLGL